MTNFRRTATSALYAMVLGSQAAAAELPNASKDVCDIKAGYKADVYVQTAGPGDIYKIKDAPRLIISGAEVFGQPGRDLAGHMWHKLNLSAEKDAKAFTDAQNGRYAYYENPAVTDRPYILVVPAGSNPADNVFNTCKDGVPFFEMGRIDAQKGWVGITRQAISANELDDRRSRDGAECKEAKEGGPSRVAGLPEQTKTQCKMLGYDFN